MAQSQRAATAVARSRKADFVKRSGADIPQNRKTRPGGQPDGSRAIWALGVDGRSRRIQPRWGGITAPTDIVSREARQSSNGPAIFLTFWRGIFGRKTTARRADGLRQRPTCRTPRRQGVDSERGSRERPSGPKHLQPVCPKPWLPASRARGPPSRSRRRRDR